MKIVGAKPKEGDHVCKCGQGLAVIKLDEGNSGRICSQCWMEREKEKEKR